MSIIDSNPEALTASLVTEDSRLNELCEFWRNCRCLAIDTEFIRVSTFYPQPGLIQVCDGEQSHLLDPVALTQWQPFIALLQDPGIVKILHSCSEDLVVFLAFFDLIPANLFDTQKAAAFLGHGYSLSYQNLVREWLGIELSKGETRSDWLRRPLSPEQLHYAALDVSYLPGIYQSQVATLEQKGLLAWCRAECEQMRALCAAQEDPAAWGSAYLNLSAAWRLQGPRLGALRALCQWREEQARKRDKPRSWVARDQDLISIAEVLPTSEQALLTIRDLPPSLARRDARGLLQCVREGQERLEGLVSIARPLTPDARKTIRKLQHIVREKAASFGLAEELLARKRHLIAILQSHRHGGQEWPDEIGGWQRELLEEAFREVLRDASA